MSARKYTRELLAPIVAASRSMSEVIRRLGVRTNRRNHRNVSGAVRRAGLDTSHFGSSVKRLLEETGHERLAQLVRASTSYRQVLIELGLPTDGRPSHDLKRFLAARNFDTSHFLGGAWSRGKTKETSAGVSRNSMTRSQPDERIFTENGPTLRSHWAKQKLIAMGWKYECAICALKAEWCGRPLVLHLDHINGISNDNRYVNLRLLCPNCHSQTPTYCRRAREDGLLASTWAWYTNRQASVA